MAEGRLEEFPNIPASGKITVAEYGAQLVSLVCNPDNPVDGQEFVEGLNDYHKINDATLKPILAYRISSMQTNDCFKPPIIPGKHEGMVKVLWDTWREDGIKGVEKYLRGIYHRNYATYTIYGVLHLINSLRNGLDYLNYETCKLFFPHLALSPAEVVESSSQVRNWQKSWTRCIEWHPNFSRFAIALKDDSIRIFAVRTAIIPLLRCQDQKNVSSIAWRPFIATELAIGVQHGVLIWKMDSPKSIKPVGCRSKLLKVHKHAPVTSVQYSSSGLLLLSSSSYDTSVYIWDSSTWRKTPLRRIGGGGVPLAIWSPGGDRILTTSPTSVFRIWDESRKWTPLRWTTPKDPVDAACWSPDGSILIFSSGGMLYAVHFTVDPITQFIQQNDLVATPLFDLTECSLSCEEDKLKYRVGGKVRKLDWDHTGNRLAVLFDHSDVIALFRVQQKSTHFLAPLGFIRGFPDEYPLAIAFQKDFQSGAVLSIAWSSGRFQYVPFLFAVPSSSKNLLHQDNYKTPSIMLKARYRQPTQTGNAFASTGSTFRTASFSNVPLSETNASSSNIDLASNLESALGHPRLFSTAELQVDFS